MISIRTSVVYHFHLFINDLHKSVKHNQILLRFAGDTNLLYANKSMKKVNKHINPDLSLSLSLSLSVSLSLSSNWYIIQNMTMVPKFLSKTIYYSHFNSHLIYACPVWSKNKKFLEKLPTLQQDKAIRIINFKQYDYSVYELYHINGTLKIKEYIDLLNCLFVKSVISNAWLVRGVITPLF